MPDWVEPLHPEAADPLAFPATVRDDNTDHHRMGEGAVGRGGYVPPPLDLRPLTLEDEAVNGGWSKVNSPVPARPDNTGRGSSLRGEPGMDSDVGEDPYPPNGRY